jgi:hypothetical protein
VTLPSAARRCPLVTYGDLSAPAKSDPSKTEAELALTRMTSATAPMPPAPAAPASASEIAAMSAWVAGGMPPGTCELDAGTSPGLGPFTGPPVCTSGVHWTQGNEGPLMNPGKPCLSCHGQPGSEAPSFILAGTVYPTGHEPDLCDGVNGSGKVVVMVTDASNKVWNLPVNAAGNFYQAGSPGSIALPFHARVTRAGKERVMMGAQSSGDCNGCHTEAGHNGAPGRIVQP